jgi:CO/xanthine dehydrogenase FAD-binding subunit
VKPAKFDYHPSASIDEALALLHQAVKWIGHLPTRSRGTIGGSVVHADPAAEIPMVLRALDGEVVARRVSAAS